MTTEATPAIAPISGQILDTNTFATLAPAVKPGVQSSELYVSLFAKLLGIVAALGLLGGESYMKIAGLAVVAVVTVGYAISRGLVKSAAAMPLLILGLLGLEATQSACHGPVPIPVSDLIDCTKAEGGAEWASIEAKLAPDALSGSWSQLVIDATAIAPAFALHIVECVAEDLIQQYGSVHHADTASTWDARSAAEKIRGKDSTGKPLAYKTSHGNL